MDYPFHLERLRDLSSIKIMCLVIEMIFSKLIQMFVFSLIQPIFHTYMRKQFQGFKDEQIPIIIVFYSVSNSMKNLIKILTHSLPTYEYTRIEGSKYRGNFLGITFDTEIFVCFLIVVLKCTWNSVSNGLPIEGIWS